MSGSWSMASASSGTSTTCTLTSTVDSPAPTSEIGLGPQHRVPGEQCAGGDSQPALGGRGRAFLSPFDGADHDQRGQGEDAPLERRRARRRLGQVQEDRGCGQAESPDRHAHRRMPAPHVVSPLSSPRGSRSATRAVPAISPFVTSGPCREKTANGFGGGLRRLARHEMSGTVEHPAFVGAGEQVVLTLGGGRGVVGVFPAVYDQSRHRNRRLFGELVLDVLICRVSGGLAPSVQVGVDGDLGPVRVVPRRRRAGELLLAVAPVR